MNHEKKTFVEYIVKDTLKILETSEHHLQEINCEEKRIMKRLGLIAIGAITVTVILVMYFVFRV